MSVYCESEGKLFSLYKKKGTRVAMLVKVTLLFTFTHFRATINQIFFFSFKPLMFDLSPKPPPLPKVPFCGSEILNLRGVASVLLHVQTHR